MPSSPLPEQHFSSLHQRAPHPRHRHTPQAANTQKEEGGGGVRKTRKEGSWTDRQKLILALLFHRDTLQIPRL